MPLSPEAAFDLKVVILALGSAAAALAHQWWLRWKTEREVGEEFDKRMAKLDQVMGKEGEL